MQPQGFQPPRAPAFRMAVGMELDLDQDIVNRHVKGKRQAPTSTWRHPTSAQPSLPSSTRLHYRSGELQRPPATPSPVAARASKCSFNRPHIHQTVMKRVSHLGRYPRSARVLENVRASHKEPCAAASRLARRFERCGIDGKTSWCRAF